MGYMIYCPEKKGDQFDRKYLLIEYTDTPSMCPEFDPDPYQVLTTVFYVNMDDVTITKINDSKTLKSLYKNVVGRNERISVWQAIKDIEEFEEKG